MAYYNSPRGSGGQLPYRDPPPRWDPGRYADERDRRETVIERERVYDDFARPPPRRAPVYEEDRYFEEDRYGPRGSRQERRYYEQDDIYNDPRASGGQVIPFRPPPRPMEPPRPGLLRRQSSLDTFDRGPRRYPAYDDRYPPPGRIPVGPPPRGDYEDIRIQDDYYGDPGFREYKEREWVRRRRRDSSHSRERGPEIREEIIEKREEVIEEKPFPRRGKTKMPKRLVHTKVLYDLGYPYYEENDTTIIIEKALGPQNIDEIINLSKDYWSKETITTRLIEAPSRGGGPEIIGEKVFEEIRTVPFENAPPSVQNWDNLRSHSPGKSHRSHRSHRSHSRRAKSRRSSSSSSSSRSRGDVVKETIIRKESIREISPGRSERRHSHSHHGGDPEIIRKKIIDENDNFDESESLHIGPLALVRDHRKSRSDREIKDEIRRLEEERHLLRKERSRNDDVEVVKVERIRERSPSPARGEVIIERRDGEVVEVRKDRRARSRSAAPSPAVIRAMMATLT